MSAQIPEPRNGHPSFLHDTPPVSLSLRNVRLSVGTFHLEIDCQIAQPIAGLFGPSGAGKTTLLELIAGLRRADAGVVALGDLILADQRARLHLASRLRRIGYVPQDLALFPHLNVRQNLLYGHQRVTEHDPLLKLDHVADVLEIGALFARHVGDLSGGEQQRVAFARALLAAPRLLLLDEPMSSLDTRLKQRLIPYLHRIRDEFQIPMIYVTHDVAEATALCDEVLLLDRGRLISRGPPADVLGEQGRKPRMDANERE